MRCLDPQRRGLTLVEVVVVLSILGIAGLAVAPAVFRSEQNDALTRSAAAVTRMLNGARQVALEHGETVSVIVAPSHARYWLFMRTAAGDSMLVEGRLLLEPGVTLASRETRARFVFDRFGSAQADSLILRHQAGARIVGVVPWTGEPFAK